MGLVALSHVEASWTRDWTRPLHWQRDSRPLDHHGSLEFHQCLRRGKSIDELKSPEKEEPQCQSFRNLGTSGFRGNWFSIIINNWIVSSNIVWNWVGTEGEGSFQFSLSAISNSLWLHGLEHTRLPCPSLTCGACSNSCPLSWWCHPTISSSVIPFSSCHQSFPASGSFLMRRGKWGEY